jgi:hypothetical protein
MKKGEQSLEELGLGGKTCPNPSSPPGGKQVSAQTQPPQLHVKDNALAREELGGKIHPFDPRQTFLLSSTQTNPDKPRALSPTHLTSAFITGIAWRGTISWSM